MVLFQNSGLAQGVQQAGSALSQALGQGLTEMAKRRELNQILGMNQSSAESIGNDPEFRQQFLDMISNYQKESGQQLNPKQLDMIWNAQIRKAQGQSQTGGPQQYNMQQLAAIAQRNPQLAAMIQRDQQMLQRERLKSEYESPEVKKYRESLGMREETATQLAPALENARQFTGDPSRFIKGTKASKALGDLATRAFAFYKPLFGGRLTQKEFERSIQNLASDKTFPGGYEQAINLIDSMITQATNEADSFNKYLDMGYSPLKARRSALLDARKNSGQIIEILKGTKKAGQQGELVEGKIYVNPSTNERIQWTNGKWRKL